MDETNSSGKEKEKPFSVLEKFRQLKKEKEQVPTPTATSKELDKAQETPGTSVFQTSGSPTLASNGDFGRGGFRGRGFRGGFGRGRGKRSFYSSDNSAERPSKRLAADHCLGQMEADVGITEFVRNGPGFDVILKHRYTDFHVNEIDLEGNVMKLTSLEIPKEEVKTTETEDLTILTAEQWGALKEIVEKKLPDTVEIDVTDSSKEERQKIHKAVKMRFGVNVYSNTKEANGRKMVKIGYGNQKFRMSRWPDDRPEYLHFLLLKENCETANAINVLSKHIHIKANKFGYAGTKDKRAVTTQQICLRRVDADRFRNCNSWRGMHIGNFSYKWTNLRLGDLSGNRFKVALRNAKASDEVIEEAVESLKKNGFINYFGMQRFGQSALVPTYLVGKAILSGDWKLATELILKPRPGEASFRDVQEAREVWWETRDASEALKCLSRREKSLEGKILSALKKLGPNAYQNAFDSLPRHSVTLYLHSYQSLVWNRVVTRRLREFGLRVLPGDLVVAGGGREGEAVAYRGQEREGESESEKSEDEEEDENNSEAPGSDGCRIQVRELTTEEAETASIFDVVYPLPGDDIRFPNNEIAKWYMELLEADGFSMASFGYVNKKYGMYGAYRKMLEKVEDLNWYVQRYSDPDEDLLVSDIDIYHKRPPLALDPNGPYKAVVIEFNLKTCSYATMAIRELAKCETSVVGQTKLTNQARNEDLALKKQRSSAEETELETKAENRQVNKIDNDLPSNNGIEEGQSSKKTIGDQSSGVEVENAKSSSVDVEDAKELVTSCTKIQMDLEDCDSNLVSSKS